MYILKHIVSIRYENDSILTMAVSESIDSLKALATEQSDVFDQQWEDSTVDNYLASELIIEDNDESYISYTITNIELV